MTKVGRYPVLTAHLLDARLNDALRLLLHLLELLLCFLSIHIHRQVTLASLPVGHMLVSTEVDTPTLDKTHEGKQVVCDTFVAQIATRLTAVGEELGENVPSLPVKRCDVEEWVFAGQEEDVGDVGGLLGFGAKAAPASCVAFENDVEPLGAGIWSVFVLFHRKTGLQAPFAT